MKPWQWALVVAGGVTWVLGALLLHRVLPMDPRDGEPDWGDRLAIALWPLMVVWGFWLAAKDEIRRRRES